MGISNMQKVMIATHKSDKTSLLEKLQSEGIIHIKDIKKSKLSEIYKEFLPKEEIKDTNVEDRIILLSRVIEYLKKFTPPAGFMEAFLPQKFSVDDKIYNEVINSSSNIIEEAKKIKNLETELNELEREQDLLTTQKDNLIPWETLDYGLEEIKSSDKINIICGIINNPVKDLFDKLAHLPIDYEIIKEETRKLYLIISYIKKDEEEVHRLLSDIGFEQVSFTGLKGRPKDIIAEINSKLNKLVEKKQKILDESKNFAKDIYKFFILYDHYNNLINRTNVENLSLSTSYTICIEGWIRTKDYKKLENIVQQFPTASLTKIEPEPDESPPVELENKHLLNNFESITKLYSTPQYNELDPSPFLAPFFAIFFALCLSDVFYGVIFFIICLFMMKKIKGSKSLLKVFIIGSLLTIPIGMITGSWFGDFPEKFNITWLLAIKEKLIVFNPMKEPLKFFILALALGFIQIMVGYFLGFIKLIKQGAIIEAISNKLCWIIFWFSIILFAFSFTFTQIFGKIKIISAILAVLSALVVLFFSGGKSRNFVIKIAKGGFNLYQGLMGTVGDIISYSRLMALGLVTMGLAVAINIIADMTIKMPYIKYVFAPLIFLGGHIFSVGINVLGAYVHSLRLQYAEFFTKFFDGGGEPFTPFSIETKYTILEKQ